MSSAGAIVDPMGVGLTRSVGLGIAVAARVGRAMVGATVIATLDAGLELSVGATVIDGDG
jgi:hypothetical protein